MNKSYAMVVISALLLAACAGSNDDNAQYAPIATPTVDYIESLDVYSAPHKDSFLNQLAMNYRSYAIYNARTSGYSEMGELFAQKAVAAFSGELPFPETLENWPVEDDNLGFELNSSYNRLLDELKNDAADTNPEVAAEAQAKFDCWLSASASGQASTAKECKTRFEKAMEALNCGGKTLGQTNVQTVTDQTKVIETTINASETVEKQRVKTETYYPETRRMAAMSGTGHARDGVIIVNNVNVPEHLINPVPVQPMVFNQNIYGGDKTIEKTMDKSVNNSGNVTGNTAIQARCSGQRECVQRECPTQQACPQCPEQKECTQQVPEVAVVETVETVETREIPMVSEELVTREEFINMMMAMRSELAAINARLDRIQAGQNERTMIKVQQIPLEPKQHVMEEIFEVRFDFDKSTIKPEYQELIRKLATATQENKNIKVSVVGHTDTSGSASYNYALGGKRAEAVQKMLIQYGIPASQIVAVSAGEKDLKIQTGDGVKNADNRRVHVVKEVHYTEPAKPSMAIEVEEYRTQECGMYGCSN